MGFTTNGKEHALHVHPFGRASPSVINRLIKAGSLLSPTCPSRDIRAMPSVPQAATPMKPRANLGNRTLVESLTWCDYRHGIVPRCLSGLRWPLKERSVNKGHEFELRMKRGLTQRELEERSGVHHNAIAKFETGERNIRDASLDTALRLCDALRVANPRKLLDSDSETSAD